MPTSTAARRGEAHLWLLLEEALVAVGRGGAETWDVQRHFRYVADAIAAAGVVAPATTQALKHELDDALVVRRLVPAASFTGAEAPDPAAEPAEPAEAPEGGALVWLEAELERHLDLLSDYDPATRPDAAAETLRILAGPARAFEASGVLGAAGRALLADLTATAVAAGYDPGRAGTPDGRVRRDWARFLRDRPPPLAAPFEPSKSVRSRTVLGALGDREVRVDEVAWNDRAVELTVSLRRPGRFALDERAPIQARAVDGRGHLHLGQPTRAAKQGGTSATLQLRPGLEDGVTTLQVRVTSNGHKVEGAVAL